MATIYTNHITVQGFRHVLKQTPCEDASDAGFNPEFGRAFAAVADGHGASIYARSKEGAAFAVESVKSTFKTFADSHSAGELDACFADEASQKEAMQELIGNLLTQWRARVMRHISQNAVCEEELFPMPEKYAALYRAGKHLLHLYGTTLIAALQTDNWLILLHQGDGRCAVLYEDGSMDQPIPWDEGCYQNITTSLCDVDAAEHFRWKIIDLRKVPVTMVFLGSDGVEDSFTKMEEMHTLYKRFACCLSESAEKYESVTAEVLPGLTKSGSKDDISVSVIADTERLAKLAPALRREVERQTAEVKLKKLREDLTYKKNFLDRLLKGVVKTEDELVKALAKATGGDTVDRVKFEELLRSDHPDVYEAADIFCDAKIAYDAHRPEYAETESALREAEAAFDALPKS